MLMTGGNEEAIDVAGPEIGALNLRPSQVAALGMTSTVAILVADLLLETGVAGGLLYVTVIALSASIAIYRSTCRRGFP